MPLPRIPGEITPSVVDYLQEMVKNGSNPEKVRSVILFFDEEECRPFFLPGATSKVTFKDQGFNHAAANIPTSQLIRTDSILYVTYIAQNPESKAQETFAWVYRNGQHWSMS